MPFKMSTQSEKLAVVRGAKRVKTLFLSRDVFIEIWFLNVNWTQNLNFRKILSPQNDLSKSILSKSARTKNFRFKNWSICRKNFHFKIRIFFQKIPFQNLIFNEKVYFRIMTFKTSTKIEKLVVFRGGNQVKTLFLRCDVLIDIWFLNINLTQNINFGNYFFSTNWLFKKFRFRNLPERKTFNWKPDILEFFGCFRIWFLFFWKLHFKLWFSMKEFATKSCLLEWARKVKNLLLSAEQIESKRFFSDVIFSSKPDFSVKIELKNWVRGKYFFSRIWLFEKFFIRNLPERRILNSKTDFLKIFFSNFHCAGKRLLQNLIHFFLKISFQTLIFNEKVCYKVMLFKMSTQSEKLVVVRGAKRVKTLFLSRDVFIETWLLNVNWTQNLNFGNYFFSTNWLFKKFRFRNLPERKTFNWKPDILEFFGCFRIWFLFFLKLHFKLWFSMKEFATKSCLLKWARKVKNLLLSAEHIESKRFFFRCEFFIETWFLCKNWIQKLSFWKHFFSRIWLFEKFFIRNLLERRILNSKTDFWNFSSQISIVQENVCFRISFLFFWKFHLKLWFSMKKFALSHAF